MSTRKLSVKWRAANVLLCGVLWCYPAVSETQDGKSSLPLPAVVQETATRYRVAGDELQLALARLPGWAVVDGKLRKHYEFKSFSDAMGWMVSVAIYAEKMDHHPEWFNVYNLVTVDLVTHDLANTISNWDIELAEKMDEFAAGVMQ